MTTPTEVDADGLLAALAAGDPIEAPVLVVTAHPDDETIGLGTRLPLLRRGHLLQITDGAPATMDDAQAAGFADRAAYRAARAAERTAALRALGAALPTETLGIEDQTTVHRLPALVAAIRSRLADASAVVTHSYEGGHPDHDAAAFAVAAACRLERRAGRRAPVHLEFAGYHLDGARVSGRFCRGTDVGLCARMSASQLAAKAAALAAYRSQAAVVAWFAPDVERFRLAPAYDFLRAPPPGAALYDSWGWSLTSEVWRAAARSALQDLFGPEPCHRES